MPESWLGYDSIADTYSRVIAARLSTPARIVAERFSNQQSPLIALDVGVGTGVSARALLSALPPGSRVTGIDISHEMLLEAQRSGLTGVIRGDAQSLPFSENVFDLTISNFVLSHVSDYLRALSEMWRVMRHGGRLAVAFWAESRRESPALLRWKEVASKYVSPLALEMAHQRAVPAESSLSRPDTLRQSLSDAGFVDVHVELIRSTYRVATADHANELAAYSMGRYMRASLPHEGWDAFLAESRAELGRRFPPELDLENDFLLGTAQRA